MSINTAKLFPRIVEGFLQFFRLSSLNIEKPLLRFIVFN